MPLVRRSFGGQRLKSESQYLTDGGPVETPFIVRLHVLIRNTHEVFDNSGILWDMENNKSLARADTHTPVSVARWPRGARRTDERGDCVFVYCESSCGSAPLLSLFLCLSHV